MHRNRVAKVTATKGQGARHKVRTTMVKSYTCINSGKRDVQQSTERTSQTMNSRDATCLPYYTATSQSTDRGQHKGSYFTTSVVTYSGMRITYKDSVTMG